MAKIVRMPDLGTTVDHLAVSSWLIEPGQTVQQGQPLLEVETDKAVSEVESIASGTLLRVLVENGEDVETGTVIAVIGDPGDDVDAILRGDAPPQAPVAAPAAAPVESRPREPRKAPLPAPAAETGPPPSTPASQEIYTWGGETEPDCSPYEQDELFEMYRDMVRIRRFEEKVRILFLEGVMPGTIHQCDGQEACAVGVCSALYSDDVITSTHRPHGHAIAKGIPITALMSELFGRVDGCCKGKGGSMHFGDMAYGMVPAIATVGSNVPVAAGAALAFKLRKEPRVCACFFGDGATNEGAFHEGVNLASVWSLPVIYVCENNYYGASTPVTQSMRVEHVAERAAAYGIPSRIVDGNDVIAVHEATREYADKCRCGKGPFLLELKTYRLCGHSRRDPKNYQPDPEKEWWIEHEPIGRFRRALVKDGKATDTELDAIGNEVEQEIDAAIVHAQAADFPKPEDALEDVWA
jgi:pyruvate dehydrogenase E1 component alpha subunit